MVTKIIITTDKTETIVEKTVTIVEKIEVKNNNTHKNLNLNNKKKIVKEAKANKADVAVTIVEKIEVKNNNTHKDLNFNKSNMKKIIKEAKANKAEVEIHKEEGDQEDNELNI